MLSLCSELEGGNQSETPPVPPHRLQVLDHFQEGVVVKLSPFWGMLRPETGHGQPAGCSWDQEDYIH